jgi:PAS domain S-box-containing protein
LASLGLTVILPWIITGGAAGTGLWFSIPYVCWVFFLNEKGPSVFWLTIYALAATTISYLAELKIITIAYTQIQLLNMLLIYILTFVLLFLFERVRDSQAQLSKDEIEERKKSEERLLLANEQLFVFFDLNPVATYIASSDDEKFRFVNEAFLKMFSLDREMIIGKSVVELGLITQEEHDRVFGFLKTNHSHFAGYEYRLKNGVGKTLDILGYNEGMQMDGRDYYIGTMQNISEIKETEERLRKLSEFQDIMLNGTDYAIITTNGQTGIISSFNKGAEKMTGYTEEEMVGKTTPKILHDYDEVVAKAKELSEELRMHIEPGLDVFHKKVQLGYPSDINEWTFIRKDKTRITIELSLSLLKNKDGDILGYIGIARDITVRKKLENDLRAAKQLAEESVILKEAFLANMSHEIRTPMNAIIGFTDLLLRKQLPAQELDYVQTIKKSGENLLRIINDILDVSKIDSGVMEFEEHPISIREIFSSLGIMLSQKANEKKLKLDFQFDAQLPDTVLGDPTRLTQVILNLVGNAIKFTKTGGVYVFAKLLKEETDSYYIEFSVKDTGIGIAADKLQLVFERFSQAEAHTTRNYGGTGLGLSIARQLVTLQGGTMNVTSQLGSGSVFSFTLPFKKTERKFVHTQLNHNVMDIEQLSQLHILLVEDNPINIKFIKSLFSNYNIEAEIAENGKIAVDKIRTNTYDLILMDIEMPEMNGYQATSIIRHDLENDVPIIAMTAHAMAGEQDKCIALGMNDYISKPINANLLFEKMIMAASSHLYSDKKETKQDRVINLEFLLQSIGDKKNVILETIDIFLDQVPADIAILQEGVLQQDYVKIKNYSHKMKSTASLIGMKEVEPLLAEMEALGAAKKDMDTIKLLNEKLDLLCKQAIEEMKQERLKYI